jgi:putative PEP-CTERM system histidine kinase
MNPETLILSGSSIGSALLGLAILLFGRRSTAKWLFFVGMLGLACNSAFDSLSLRASETETVLFWQEAGLITQSLLPGIWLCFSLSFSRGNSREFLTRWRSAITVVFLLPFMLIVGFRENLISSIQVNISGEPWLTLGVAGKALSALILTTSVVIVMNLEKTFRTAVGTMRWRIKLMMLGLSVIFGVKIYVASQELLFSGLNLSFSVFEAGALLIGCALIGLSYLRSGRVEVDVYPSQTVLYGSITVIVAGVYLFVIGIFARFFDYVDADAEFPIKAFFVLVGVVGLAIVLVSDRVRQKTKRFVSRHFQRPLYDYRDVWRRFTEGTTSRVEKTDLCQAVTTFVSDLFQVLSVTLWLVDTDKKRLSYGASTLIAAADSLRLAPPESAATEAIRHFEERPEPVDIDASAESWSETLRHCTPGEFRKGGHRICLPIVAGGELLGLLTLADRVGGIAFSVQDTDLLKCIGDQAAACLRNIQLSHRLVQAKEMEAFQTMSAFFVHDLKNTASTLSLMLRNFPVHFDDPSFREDALRGFSNTVNHINGLIGRLSLLRQGLTIQPSPCDLNQLITVTLEELGAVPNVQCTSELRPLPSVLLDREQVQKVITNLVLNARDALSQGGQIQVRTKQENSSVVLLVTDNGCGMSAEFLERSLFRPFQTTKKRGLGIGMFQTRMIVDAHHGRIEVQSQLGQGTTFRIFFPCQSKNEEA